MERSKLIKLFFALTAFFVVLFLPLESIPINSITLLQQRVLAIFVLAVLLWVWEPIPIFSTSVLIIFLELLMISDKGLFLFRTHSDAETFGQLINYKSIMGTFASPIILLFLGGYFLAMSATKYKLDQNLARVLLRPFGNNPKNVMFGLMVITAIFSMFMSNTATTAMMLAILTPVLAKLDATDLGRKAFVLAIPFAANVGGLGTPIGTPPNAVALKYLTGDIAVSFGGWMLFGVPYMIIMLIFVWFLLLKIYPVASKQLDIQIKGKFLKHWKALTVYVTFALTVVLWLTGKLHGMNSYVVAMLPVTVFSVTGIITVADLKTLSWDVLWLVSGGIALGLAMEKTGLSVNLIESIPFSNFSPYIIIASATVLAVLMATFMSNTATANLLMPIMAALGVSLSSLEPLGGVKMLIIGVAFSSSLAMCLPVSTPPNAMAHATGAIESRDMVKPGMIIGGVGLTLVYGLLFILKKVQFF